MYVFVCVCVFEYVCSLYIYFLLCSWCIMSLTLNGCCNSMNDIHWSILHNLIVACTYAHQYRSIPYLRYLLRVWFLDWIFSNSMSNSAWNNDTSLFTRVYLNCAPKSVQLNAVMLSTRDEMDWLKSCNNSGHDLLTYSLWRCKPGITLSSPWGHLAYKESDWLALSVFYLIASELVLCISQGGDICYHEVCSSFSGSAWSCRDCQCYWSAPVSVCWGVESVEERTLKGLWIG